MEVYAHVNVSESLLIAAAAGAGADDAKRKGINKLIDFFFSLPPHSICLLSEESCVCICGFVGDGNWHIYRQLAHFTLC